MGTGPILSLRFLMTYLVKSCLSPSVILKGDFTCDCCRAGGLSVNEVSTSPTFPNLASSGGTYLKQLSKFIKLYKLQLLTGPVKSAVGMLALGTLLGSFLVR